MSKTPANDKIIAWWSAGVTSAVATKLALQEFGDKVVPMYFKIKSAHEDNIRFKKQCEDWYGCEILEFSSEKYADQFDVIEKTGWINGPSGARCTIELKKKIRLNIEKTYKYNAQVFGFEFSKKEINRALRFKEQYPKALPIFPLIEKRLTKPECLFYLENAGIKKPVMYSLGYKNNNCIACVKGGAGYFNKIKIDFPDHFERLAKLERKVGRSCIKGTFLDELKPNQGQLQKEVIPDCGNFCDIEFEDLTHPQLEFIFEYPNLMRNI